MGTTQQVGPANQEKLRMEPFVAAESLPCTQDVSWKSHPGMVKTMAMASTFMLLQQATLKASTESSTEGRMRGEQHLQGWQEQWQ